MSDSIYTISGKSSNDGTEWKCDISLKFLMICQTLKNMIDALGDSDDRTIPLDKFDKEIFESFYNFYVKANEFQYEDSGLGIVDYLSDPTKNEEFFAKYIREDNHQDMPHFKQLYEIFNSFDVMTVKNEFIRLADFLDNKGMLDLLCTLLGYYISNADEEEIKKIFAMEIQHNLQLKRDKEEQERLEKYNADQQIKVQEIDKN